MRKRLTDVEYWKEVAEIREHFNKLKKRIEESQRVGWLMKKNIKWQRLQRKKEQMINAQEKKRLLKVIEYLEKDLETEASSGTKGSKSLASDIFCMFVGTIGEKEQTADVVTEEENGAATCFEDVHAQLEKDSTFQHSRSRGDLVYDIG